MKLRRPDANATVVYSTDPRPAAAPAPPSAPATAGPPGGGPALKIRLEKKGRGGKAVTVIAGVPGNAARVENLARTLKTHCGAGGTVKGAGEDVEIEIQGDHRARVAARLRELGYTVKGA